MRIITNTTTTSTNTSLFFTKPYFIILLLLLSTSYTRSTNTAAVTAAISHTYILGNITHPGFPFVKKNYMTIQIMYPIIGNKKIDNNNKYQTLYQISYKVMIIMMMMIMMVIIIIIISGSTSF